MITLLVLLFIPYVTPIRKLILQDESSALCASFLELLYV